MMFKTLAGDPSQSLTVFPAITLFSRIGIIPNSLLSAFLARGFSSHNPDVPVHDSDNTQSINSRTVRDAQPLDKRALK